MKSQAVYRDEELIVIRDISPQAPVHLLVIPCGHYPTPEQFMAEADPTVIANVFSAAAKAGGEHAQNGFRIVVNQGSEGGQTVGHVHVHVLGGRPLRWPPG
ncbi:MAG: histidine triad nucleotide-binding protein [Vulcanimicrobiaceae bacterium]